MAELDVLCNSFREIHDVVVKRKLRLRLTGSIAVQIACQKYSSLVGPERRFADLDFAAHQIDYSNIDEALQEMGFESNQDVYVASEGQRAIYDNYGKGIHLDIFFDKLEFSHTIDIRNRIDLCDLTLPVANLLLGKLQIHEINEKDLIDAIILMLEYDLSDHDVSSINVFYISELCSESWGLWRTVMGNLEKVEAFLATSGMLEGMDIQDKLLQRIQLMKQMLVDSEKSFKWRMRSKIGDKVRWYSIVEEVD